MAQRDVAQGGAPPCAGLVPCLVRASCASCARAQFDSDNDDTAAGAIDDDADHDKDYNNGGGKDEDEQRVRTMRTTMKMTTRITRP